MAIKLINRIVDGIAELFVKGGNLRVEGNAIAKVNRVSDVYLGCPIGTIVMWAGTTEPDGWLLCNGRDISTDSNYNELNQILGHTYNISGDGDSVVRLPNLQQKFPLGAQQDGTIGVYYENDGNTEKHWMTNLGEQGGEDTIKLDYYNIPNRTTTTGNTYGCYQLVNTDNTPNVKDTNNTPSFLAVNFIIKYR